MGRQRLVIPEELRHDDRRQVDLVIQVPLERRVALGRGQDQEHGHRFGAAPVGQHGDGSIAKPRALVGQGLLIVAQLQQEEGEPLVGLPVLRIQAEDRFIVLPGRFQVPLIPQEVGQIDPGQRVPGMQGHGLPEGSAGGGAVAHGLQQEAEVVERSEVRRVALEDLEIGLPGLLLLAQERQHPGPVEVRLHIIRSLRQANGGLLQGLLSFQELRPNTHITAYGRRSAAGCRPARPCSIRCWA